MKHTSVRYTIHNIHAEIIKCQSAIPEVHYPQYHEGVNLKQDRITQSVTIAGLTIRLTGLQPMALDF